MGHVRRATGGNERGAALLEFALVLPLLLLVMFGMVEMGVRLTHQHTLEDGIRDAARSAAVDQTGSDTGCAITGPAPPSAVTHQLICLAKDRIGLDEADTRIRIVLGGGGAAEGEPVLLCAQYPADSVTGIDLFSMSHLTARSVMRLEADSEVQAYSEASLAGGWTGCSL